MYSFTQLTCFSRSKITNITGYCRFWVMWHLRGLYATIVITYVALRIVYIIRRVRYDSLLIKTLDRSMASSSSSFSSKRQDELQSDHPCDCDLPSRVKTSRTPDNPGRKFRVCQNSLVIHTFYFFFILQFNMFYKFLEEWKNSKL